MKIKKNKLTLTILMLLYALISYADNRPSSLVKQFYDWRFKTQFAGVPEKATLKATEPFLSAELICMLDRARLSSKIYQKIPDR